jgi:UDP-sugar transporter A1/2/3
MVVNLSWKAWFALGIFVLQNGLAGILIQWSKTHGVPYNSQVAVLMQEAAVKLPVSLILFAVECGGPVRMARAIGTDASERYVEWLQARAPCARE